MGYIYTGNIYVELATMMPIMAAVGGKSEIPLKSRRNPIYC
jgi:hypothetical protein